MNNLELAFKLQPVQFWKKYKKLKNRYWLNQEEINLFKSMHKIIKDFYKNKKRA